jgi:hypothetical protein
MTKPREDKLQNKAFAENDTHTSSLLGVHQKVRGSTRYRVFGNGDGSRDVCYATFSESNDEVAGKVGVHFAITRCCTID